MKYFIIILALCTGCSELFIERISSEKFSPGWTANKKAETKPFITEHPIGIDNDRLGVSKKLWVHNPLDYDIEVNIKCESMFNDNPTVKIRARTSRYWIIGANHSQELTQSCFLLHYEATFIEPLPNKRVQ